MKILIFILGIFVGAVATEIIRSNPEELEQQLTKFSELFKEETPAEKEKREREKAIKAARAEQAKYEKKHANALKVEMKRFNALSWENQNNWCGQVGYNAREKILGDMPIQMNWAVQARGCERICNYSDGGLLPECILAAKGAVVHRPTN